MGWKAFIREDSYGLGLQLFLGEIRGGGAIDALSRPAGGYTLKRHDPGKVNDDPAFMDGDMAAGVVQAILDAAWAHGMRPTGISGEKGEIQRLEGHLADMRAIAFHTTKAPKPER